MSVLQAFILGIIQGLTEFLPISSSGHLMLVENVFGLQSGNMFFNVLLHFATLIAVVIIFWKDIVCIIKSPFKGLGLSIIISTIPTIILALIVENIFNEFQLMAFVGFGFLISAIIMAITTTLQKDRINLKKGVSYKNSLIMGVVQGCAVFPGISRSGSTICAGLLCGIERESCAKFSFLMSLPVIFGGMCFELYDGIKIGFGNINFVNCIVGFISAFIVALFTIKFMINIVKKGKWWGFAIYLFLLSILVILNQFVFQIF